MASGESSNGQKDLVDEFEDSFQACLTVLSGGEGSGELDSLELKTDVDQSVWKFLDLARQLDCFLLQKRLLCSALKPEQILKEDMNDLKNELSRKTQLLERHYEKIANWQAMLYPKSNQTRAPPPPPPPPPAAGAAPHPMPPHRMQAPSGPVGMPGTVPTGYRPSMMADGSMIPSQLMTGPGGLQGPLAYLEKTTSNIGMPDIRR